MVENLLRFIRFRICVFTSFIGMTGYLLFHPLDVGLIFVSLACFFGCAGVYSYNTTKDKIEDLINNRKINSFSSKNKGLFIVFICFLVGYFFVSYLSFHSILFYTLSIITGIFYSFSRIKQHFMIKNIYTGFGIGQVFLIGTNYFTQDVLLYYFLISFFIYIASLISDLRDYEGDSVAGINTLPVALNYNITKNIIYFLLILFCALIITLNLYRLSIMFPFVLLIFYFLHKNNPFFAHSFAGYSFLFLVFWLIIT